MGILGKPKSLFAKARAWLRKQKTECNVVITGSARSGKTAFMISLLAHLEHYDRDDPNRLDIPGKELSDLHGFKIHPTKPINKRDLEFPYRKYLAHLSHWEWPEKTKDCGRFHCTFSHVCPKQRKLTKVDLTLNDLPGERISDMLMLSHANYDDWCDNYLQQIDQNPPVKRRLEASGFSAVIASAGAAACAQADYLAGFKKFLLLGLREHARSVSPSTFVFDLEGREASDKLSDDDLIVQRFSGLEGAEFAPLDAPGRKQNKKMAKAFRAGFKRYRKDVLAPLLELIKESDTLLVLVDVPFTLMHGVSAKQETQEFLRQLALVAADQRTWFFRRSIKRALVVASKDDMVRRSELELGRLKKLSQRLAKPATDILFDAGISSELMTCSAIVSTDEHAPGDAELCGITKYLPGTKRLRNVTNFEVADAFAKRNRGEPWGQIYQVPELPDLWPETWLGADYAFVETLPLMPSVQDRPPPQRGLEPILRYLLDWKC